MTQSFAATIEETLEYVERALARIQEGDGAETEAFTNGDEPGVKLTESSP